MTSTDFTGQELGFGDPVLLVAGKYVELRRGIVVGFTAQKVRVMTPSMWNRSDCEPILIFPYQCTRVAEDLTTTQVWTKIRDAAAAAK